MTGPRSAGRAPALLLPALLALLAVGLPARAQDRCAAPHELVEGDGALPAMAEAVSQRRPVKIVALGGAATAGSGASDPAASYPMRFGDHLRRRLPGIEIQVVNKAAPRQSAVEMLGRLKGEVMAEKPTLVVWQTGTVDAVRGVGVESFARTLGDGLKRIKAGAADALLVDPQYSPQMIGLMNLAPFVEAMHMLGETAHGDVFKRFAIMRFWDESARFDFAVKPPALTREIDAVYDCLGSLMAELVVDRLRRAGVKLP